jgi:NAD-dependent deacetylase
MEKGNLLSVIDTISNADYMIALTGAGISKESNVPTFRGADGLWRNYDAMELATPDAFRRNPNLVWQWYAWRQGLIAECSPNPGHLTLAKWERDGLLKSLITQNVDGLHIRAGSKNVLEVHGDLWELKCTSCDFKGRLDAPVDDMQFCPDCGMLLRPDVVWFGESLNLNTISQVYSELGRADVCMVVGTSALVQPAASFPFIVKHRGGALIEINIEQTPLSSAVDYHILGKSGEVLPELDKLLNTE